MKGSGTTPVAHDGNNSRVNGFKRTRKTQSGNKRRKNKDIQYIVTVNDRKEEDCIKNSSSYKYYKIIPFYYEFLHTLRIHPKIIFSKKSNIFVFYFF